jgi:predicted PurR-regulated permease PerM
MTTASGGSDSDVAGVDPSSAGADAGATDAGAKNARATDAGATDAGAKNARATDAGATDTGLVVIGFDTRSVRRAGLILMGLVAALMLGLWLFEVTRHFLFLILLAWLFAIALEPGIRWLIRRGRSRGTASAIVGGGALLVALLLAFIFGKLFFNQIASFVRSVPSIETSVINWVNARFSTHIDANSISSSLNLSPSRIGSWAQTLSGGVLGVVGSLSAVVFDLVTVVVFGFYFAGDGPHIFRTLATGMSPDTQKVFLNVSEITTAKTGGYVVSKIVLAALSAFFHGIFFAVIGVPYWLPFALFVGITAQFVPIVGTYLGVTLPLLATVFITPWKGLAIIAFAAVYQQIETYYFTPRVSKRTMDVNPAIALAAVFVGGAIWGPLGALIGIPLAAAGVAIFGAYGHAYELVPEISSSGDTLATDTAIV